jgi:hypothetical protein
MDLFGASGATFSQCRIYRYALWRIWDESLGMVMWIGLNPSTADETKDDPTIRRCKGFAADWGYGGIFMLNLFAFRATDPKAMMAAKDPIGPENYHWLQQYHEVAGRTIAAWGIHGGFVQQDAAVNRLERASSHAKTRCLGDDLWCLGKTKEGFPKHPLYVPAKAKPRLYLGRE